MKAARPSMPGALPAEAAGVAGVEGAEKVAAAAEEAAELEGGGVMGLLGLRACIANMEERRVFSPIHSLCICGPRKQGQGYLGLKQDGNVCKHTVKGVAL
eukprot:scaffold99257_cov18-Tisochrysis_lutea.AAC.2